MKYRDQKLASDFLKLRESGYNPWKLGFLARRQILRVIILVVYGFLWPSFSHSQLLTTGLALGGSIIIGAMFSEIAFIFRISKTWSFTEKVTDWKIVESLARKESDISKPSD